MGAFKQCFLTLHHFLYNTQFTHSSDDMFYDNTHANSALPGHTTHYCKS